METLFLRYLLYITNNNGNNGYPDIYILKVRVPPLLTILYILNDFNIIFTILSTYLITRKKIKE